MRIPPLRLIDDPNARSDAERLLQLVLVRNEHPTGFEWPLVRSMMDARYSRPCDTMFLCGFMGTTVLRWMRRSVVLVPRRWWVTPLYVGLVAREFALADSVRRCNYTDFMVLTAGMDTEMGEMSRWILDNWRGGVRNAYPQVTNIGVIPAEPKRKPPTATTGSSFKKTTAATAAGGKGTSGAPAEPRSFWSSLTPFFPSLSTDDPFKAPTATGAMFPILAVASRLLLVHSFCDVFGGSCILERHQPPTEGTRSYRMLRDGANRVTPEARISKVQSMTKYLSDEGIAAPGVSSTQPTKKPAPTAIASVTDIFVLHVSTRFFEWTPIEYVQCDRGSESALMMSVSLPAPPVDDFDNLMSNTQFRKWWVDLPHPELSRIWWNWHLSRYSS